MDGVMTLTRLIDHYRTGTVLQTRMEERDNE
jgi:hypothetical protein